MNEAARQRLHGTCLLVGECGVLIVGPSGSGKSSLALEMMDTPGRAAGGPLMEARLVADDQVMLSRDEELIARPPPELAGKLEVRGLGILDVPFAEEAVVKLVVQLTPWHDMERLPQAETRRILAVSLPLIRMDASRPRACARLRAALVHLGLA